LGAFALDEVLDHELGGRGALLEFDLRLGHALSPSIGLDPRSHGEHGVVSGSARRSASTDVTVVTLTVTGVDLARAADLQRLGVHLAPVRDPARQAAHRE